jgi:hypothetical protein
MPLLGSTTPTSLTPASERTGWVSQDVLSDGNLIVAFLVRTGAYSALYTQVVDRNGNAVAPATLVDSSTSDPFRDVTVTALAEGGYVVTTIDGSSDRTPIYRQFAADGSPQHQFTGPTSPFPVSQTPITVLDGPGADVLFAYSVDSTGSNPQYYLTVVDQNGVPGAAFQVPSASIAWDGTRILALASGPGYDGISGQFFDLDGNALGAVFEISTTEAGDQSRPIATALGDGRFVVLWDDHSATGGDVSGSAVRGQLVDGSGGKIGSEFLVNSTTTGDQDTASVTPLPNGDFAVAYESGDTGRIGVQLFDTLGHKLGVESLVATGASSPDIELTAYGRVSLAWSNGSDPYLQSFSIKNGPSRTDIDRDGDSDILFFSQSTGRVSWQNSDLTNALTTLRNNSSADWDVQSAGTFSPKSVPIGAVTTYIMKNVTTGQFNINSNGSSSASTDLRVIGTNWDARAIGDFNGDGIGDVLWHNANNGQVYIWTFDINLRQNGSYLIGNYGANWDAVAAADFDGDGDSDILLRDSTNGRQYIVEIQNGAQSGGHELATFGTDCIVASTGDYNHDLRADIALKNTVTGEFYLAQMDNFFSYVGSNLGAIGTDWNIAASGDYNGDGNDDILWRNSSTNQGYIWEMDNGRQAATGSHDLGIFSADLVIV